MSHEVCISYSSRDRDRILRIAEQLRGAGVSVWLDQGGIDAAALWSAEIVKAIDGCKVLLLALSASAAESANVVKEVSLALDRKKHILPVNLEPVEVPVALRYPLAGIQHVDLFGARADENFDTVVRALARLGVQTGDAPAAPQFAARVPRKALNDKVIAVLPFVNISPDKESDYFSDGLTEDLISNLSRMKGMSVVSRTNSIKYKGSKLDIEEIGQELGARYIIEGTVRRHMDDLRITANLIDVASSTQLWSDRYKGKMADVFDIQETVSKEIVDALELKLTPVEKVALTRRSTSIPEAFDLYLRGRDALYRQTRTSIETATRLFQQAIKLDSRYAQAHAGLGEAYASICLWFGRDDALLDKAIESSLKALMYDESISEAYSALAMAYWVRGSFDEALEAARKAIQLDAGSVIAHYTLSRVYQTTGRFAEAVQTCEQILEINPDFYQGLLGLQAGLAGMGNAEAALAVTRRVVAYFPGYLARVPDDARAHILFAGCLAEVGQREQALQEADTALALGGSDGVMLYNLACVYCRMGEPDKGAETLAQAFAAGYSNVRWALADPDLACIRQHPKFVELVAAG
jgi:TolB-like protein/tetratricopeptide (TPR) repeat protein